METKRVTSSRTIGFNLTTSILVSAVWPFLSDDFRSHDYAVPALTAWFTIGNTLLRLITHTRVDLFGASNEADPNTAP